MIVDYHFLNFTYVPAPVMSYAKHTAFTFGEDITNSSVV